MMIDYILIAGAALSWSVAAGAAILLFIGG